MIDARVASLNALALIVLLQRNAGGNEMSTQVGRADNRSSHCSGLLLLLLAWGS